MVTMSEVQWNELKERLQKKYQKVCKERDKYKKAYQKAVKYMDQAKRDESNIYYIKEQYTHQREINLKLRNQVQHLRNLLEIERQRNGCR